MKKIMLFFAGMLFLGVSATFAQADTTGTRRGASQTPAQTPTATPSDRQTDQNRNYTKDMVKIQSSDLPDNLRQTLQGTEYKGWENGTVYRTKNSDGYLVEIKNGTDKKTYRFDASGKPIQ